MSNIIELLLKLMMILRYYRTYWSTTVSLSTIGVRVCDVEGHETFINVLSSIYVSSHKAALINLHFNYGSQNYFCEE